MIVKPAQGDRLQRGTGTIMAYDGATGWYTSGSFPLGNVDGRLVAGNWNGT